MFQLVGRGCGTVLKRAIFHDSVVFKYHTLLFPVRDSFTDIMFEKIDFQFSFSLSF